MGTEVKNIVLVGFMGTGKSRVGRLLAKRLGLDFVDMDALIEERQGKPIPRIFAEEGEPAFRRMERELVRELAAREGQVIACGGGIVLNPDNLADYAATGLVVCLSAAPDTILERVAHETHRPLLAEGDKLQKIRDLLARRQPLYDAVPHQVPTDGLSAEDVAERILALRRDAQ